MVVQVLVVAFLFSLAFAAPIDLSCNVPVDLVFVLDGSDSLKESEFSASKQFVLDVIQSLTLGKQNVQVGVLVYSTFVGGTIDLGAFNTFNILKIFINNLQQPRQGTATDLAIISMQNMFNKARALQPDRQSVQKIGIVLTDGRSTSPNATINAAKAAKNAGIQLYAIGYGTDVFIYELEQIASDSQKTLILTNSMTDQAFLQEFEDKLRPRVCEVSITTEKATTTVITTLPSTEKLVPDKYCPNCMKDVNYGYKPYPGDCTKYYDVRPDENGGAIQDVKKCPFGTFWDSTYLTCQYTWMVNCVYDPCRSFSSGTLAMPGVCSGYWTCFNFRGNATCCSRPNQRYVQGVGCLEDFSCTTTCPDDDSNRIQVPQQCYRYPYQPDRSKYYEENHGFNITRSCAPGTWFDQNTCSCSITSGLNSGNIQGCGPDVSYEFNSNSGITDSSSNDVLAGFLNVVLNGQTATFNGQSMLNIWRFSNVELKNRLVIEFQFKTSGSGIQREALISNCIGSDLEEASLLIVANRGSNTVLFRTVTDKETAEISAPYIPGVMNTVTYIYDGQRMICAVSSVVVQSFLTGDIQTRQTGIIIGAASKWASFQGDIDNFHLYRCIPASVVPLLSK